MKKLNLISLISREKHKLNKEELETSKKREADIAEALRKCDKDHHCKGETSPTTTRVFISKVVKAFLKSGTPLNRIKYFRDVFEETGYSLASQSYMR